MNSDNLQLHKTAKANYKGKEYCFCSQNYFNHLVKHFNEVAMVSDAFTGDSINKADAVIGLKEKGNPEIAYFKTQRYFANIINQKNKELIANKYYMR